MRSLRFAAGPRWPRYVAAIAGAWLIVSAYAWPHASIAATNTAILGGLIAASAIVSLFVPGVHVVTALLAVWLFGSTFAMPHLTPGTLVNNLVVAVVVFLASLVPNRTIRSAGDTRPTQWPAYE
jgi:hypothetical protein